MRHERQSMPVTEALYGRGTGKRKPRPKKRVKRKARNLSQALSRRERRALYRLKESL